MNGVILAGGSGTRLRPVTLEMPKPLLTVRRKPIVNHLLDFFGRHGVSDTTLLIHRDHVDDYRWWQARYSAELPKALRIVAEPEPMGTFGGLRLFRERLRDAFVVSNGDELKDFDLTAMIRAHLENSLKPVATIALVRVPNPSDYGVPILDGNRILEFLEKPKNPPSDFVNCGLFIFEPSIFDYADQSKKSISNEYDIFPALAAAGKLAGYKLEASARWYDTGTFERWERAIKEW